MKDSPPRTDADIGAGVSAEGALATATLIPAVDRAWPSRLPRREVAGLPVEIAQVLLGGAKRGPLAEAARQLDRALPGWPEQAAAVLCRALRTRSAALSADENVRRLCALLALRPLRQPDGIMDILDSSLSASTRLWLLAALSATDTPQVRRLWLDQLRARLRTPSVEPDPALWFAFLRAFCGGWLTYADFRECLVEGRVLGAADPDGDYPRSLARLRLDSDARFSKWYRQVIYEVASQPDISLSFGAGGWIRDFPSAGYLWEAIGYLKNKPDSWWGLHMLRFASGVSPDDQSLLSRLSDLQPIILCLISLLRPDLCAAVARAAPVMHHEAAVEWLTNTSSTRPLDLRWIQTCLRPWAEQLGEAMSLAAGALCSVDPPADFPGPEDSLLRRRDFVRIHLLPEFDRLMDNVLCLHALRKEHFDTLCQGAKKGHPTAIRALSLWPERAEASAPVLFYLTRRGSQLSRRAAAESLEVLRAQTRVADLADFEKRLDLAFAWADSGLDGKPSRVWWDVSGYRVKLSVAPGNAAVHVYSGNRRLAGIPKGVREDPEYPEIRRARADLARSYRYFRRRFEEAMVEGIRYRGSEFAALLSNPVVRSLTSRLILLCDGAPFLWTPCDQLDEARLPPEIGAATEIAIAHPRGLAARKTLDEWQQRIIDSHIAQPFKQVFREVYVLSEAERADFACARFAGHPLIARRAFALLRGRGYSPGRGDASREWPGANLRALVRWASPDQDAGRLLADPDATETVTSGAVWFCDRSGRPLPLAEVASVVFSETLRDADLLVSRAAAGEMGLTSEETLRLRATLVRYLARSLGLTNVYLADDSAHALVEGKRAMYRVHLGSGSVLLETTRRHLDIGAATTNPLEDVMAESIDSLTARVLAVIAILSRDDEITTPAFLDQL